MESREERLVFEALAIRVEEVLRIRLDGAEFWDVRE